MTAVTAQAEERVQRPVRRAAPADRAALARAALARAELRTGARSVAAPEPRVVLEPAAVEEAEPAPAPTRGSGLHEHLLPVARPLARLLPEAGLRRGTAVVVTGSTSLLLALVAEASAAGSWAAFVAMPQVGLLAAAEAGVVLDRLVTVPRPGPDAPRAVAALLDGMDLVVVGQEAALADADRRLLLARARDRGAVLLSTGRWPGAAVALHSSDAQWDGIGRGYGRLRRQAVEIRSAGRGRAPRVPAAVLRLPLGPGTSGMRGTSGTREALDVRDGVGPAGPVRPVAPALVGAG